MINKKRDRNEFTDREIINNSTKNIDIINKRKSPRKAINFPVVFSDQKDILHGEIVDISESGLSINSDVLFKKGTDINIWIYIDNDYFDFRTRVVRHFENGPGNYTISLEFIDQGNNDLFNLKSLLNPQLINNHHDYNDFPYTLDLHSGNHRVISDENLIAILLTRMYKRKSPVYVKQNLSNTLFNFVLTSIDTDPVHSNFSIRNLNIVENLNSSSYQELVLFFNFQSSFYVLKTEIISIDGENICLKIPGSILQLWRRSHPKSRLELAGKNIKARLITDKNNEYILTVNDIGYRGVSLNLSNRNTADEIGNSPVKICINIDDGQDILFEASLKYLDEKLSAIGNIFKCGFEISRIDPAMKANMETYIFKHNYPYIVPFNEKYIDKIWDLFFKSDYMIPEKREYVSKVKKEIEETWIRLYGEGSKIGRMLLFVDNGEVYGTVAATLAYENTWIVHQLAGVNHSKVIIGKYIIDSMLIMLIEHLDMDSGKVYFREDNEWASNKFLKFNEFCTIDSATLYAYSALYEMNIDNYKYINYEDSSIIVDYISSKEDHVFIIDFLKKILPEIVIYNDKINYSELELPKTQIEYKKIGLFRGRKILIAKENNIIISFAVLEYGSTGINLGGLFDVFQIFTIENSNKNLHIINKILLNDIIRFYCSIGKKSALCLSSDINKSVLEDVGFIKKINYISWYGKNNCYKQIFQYFYDSYSLLNKRTIIKNQ